MRNFHDATSLIMQNKSSYLKYYSIWVKRLIGLCRSVNMQTTMHIYSELPAYKYFKYAAVCVCGLLCSSK